MSSLQGIRGKTAPPYGLTTRGREWSLRRTFWIVNIIPPCSSNDVEIRRNETPSPCGKFTVFAMHLYRAVNGLVNNGVIVSACFKRCIVLLELAHRAVPKSTYSRFPLWSLCPCGTSSASRTNRSRSADCSRATPRSRIAVVPLRSLRSCGPGRSWLPRERVDAAAQLADKGEQSCQMIDGTGRPEKLVGFLRQGTGDCDIHREQRHHHRTDEEELLHGKGVNASPATEAIAASRGIGSDGRATMRGDAAAVYAPETRPPHRAEGVCLRGCIQGDSHGLVGLSTTSPSSRTCSSPASSASLSGCPGSGVEAQYCRAASRASVSVARSTGR
jgi:hypothetical protein